MSISYETFTKKFSARAFSQKLSTQCNSSQILEITIDDGVINLYMDTIKTQAQIEHLANVINAAMAEIEKMNGVDHD